MTVEELKRKLEKYPDDYKVEIFDVYGSNDIDDISANEDNKRVVLTH